MGRKYIDMIGKTFGTFTVIRVGEYIRHARHWVLSCSVCGTEKSVQGQYLRDGRYTGNNCPGCFANKKACPEGTKRCNSCHCALPLENFFFDKHHSDGIGAWCKQCIKENKKVIYEMLSSAKGRAKEKGWDFNLTNEFLKELNEKQGGKCAYTNINLDWDYNRKGENRIICAANPTRASLDRIDSSKGYTKDNVQLVTFVVNMIKNAFTESEFLSTCQLIVQTAIENGKLK